MIILGIETSCDDTGIALVECSQPGCRILSNVVSSQVKIHAPYGGIVPNLAAREHLKNIEPCFKKVFEQADNPPIDLMSVTIGPGLIPSLLVGVNFAKALAYQWQKPIMGINHIEGHIYANWLSAFSVIKFPALCLVVSGGHTQLILMKNHGKYQLLGETRDDAAGEAFDKVARLLNLGYPGGPIISQRANKCLRKDSSVASLLQNDTIKLPRPMLNSNNFDFSFSGLKTAVLYEIKKQKKLSQKYINDMAVCFQQAVIDVLIAKTIKAAKKYKVKTVMLSGGVAANQELRQQMTEKIKIELSNSPFYIPDSKLCTDNAAMIATAAFYKKSLKQKQTWLKIQAQANLKLVA